MAIPYKDLKLWTATKAALSAGLLIGTFAGYLSATGWAQSGTSRTSANDNLIRDNRLLAEVERSAPDMLSIILPRLAPLSDGRQSPPPTRPSAMTEAEAAQMVQNPAFAAAYQRDPEGTLELLRFVNRLIQGWSMRGRG